MGWFPWWQERGTRNRRFSDGSAASGTWLRLRGLGLRGLGLRGLKWVRQ